MDAHRFDQIVADVARGQTRRTTFRLLAGAVLSGLLTPGAGVRLAAGQEAPGGRADKDGDGLFDDDETDVYRTDPDNPDTDGDGYSDGAEVYFETDPLDEADLPQRQDTDGDGLYDDDEVRIYQTDPNNPDSDGDGTDDGEEVFNGTDPAPVTCPEPLRECDGRCAGAEGAPCAGLPLDACCSGACDYLVGGGTCTSCEGHYCDANYPCCPGTPCQGNRCGDCLFRGTVCTPGGQRCCDTDCAPLDGGGTFVCLSQAGGRCKHDANCQSCYFDLDTCPGTCVNGTCQR